jgi:PAS domain S-box-containing protein
VIPEREIAERPPQIHVLIAVSSVTVRDMALRSLQDLPHLDYGVSEAAGEGELWARLTAAVPDVLLLDSALAGSPARSVLADLSDRYPNLPVILLTGQASDRMGSFPFGLGLAGQFDVIALAAGGAAASAALHDAISLALSQARREPEVLEGPLRILVIDDSEDDREACIRALRRVEDADYQFEEAADGDQGMRLIADRLPDAVLLDFSMPGRDGVDILARLHEAYPFLPVIMLSGNGSEAVAVRGMKAGAVDYFAKGGISGEALHKAILAAIECRQTEKLIDIQRRTIQRQREEIASVNTFLLGLLDRLPDPVFVLDHRQRWLLVNEAFRASLGEGGWDSCGTGTTPAQLAGLCECDLAALQASAATMHEHTLTDRQGRERVFAIKRATLVSGAGEPVLVGIMRDVTEQRRAEAAFKRQAARLVSQSQDLAGLGAILDESLQEIYVVDAASLRLLQANRGARHNLGYSRVELQEMRITDVMPELTEAQLACTLAPLASGEKSEIVYHAQLCRRNGTTYLGEIHAQLAFLQGHRVFVHIVLDETERRRMEGMKHAFISTVSHELRTPLTSIVGALGLLKVGAMGEINEKAAKMIHIAHSNAERLTRLVNDILALEKAASGRLQLEIRAVEVARLLEQAAEANASYGETHQVRFAIDPVSPGLSVEGDWNRLMQILANLLSNAAKFSPPGSTVSIRAQGNGGLVRFEVEDHGIGIPPHFRGRIFEKFAQADSTTARRFEGSGLGLSITKELVEAMSGRIGFESEPGQGTLFYFELPRTGEWMSSGQDEEKRVLICEGDSDLALLMKICIEQAGFQAEIAGSIEEARVRLNAGCFAVLMIDVGIPDGNGLDLLRSLPAEKRAMRLPVIVVGGRRTQESEWESLSESVQVSWLDKPLDHRSLAQSVRQAVLGQHRCPTILYVGPDSELAAGLGVGLQGRASLSRANGVREARALLGEQTFRLIAVDPAWRDALEREIASLAETGAHAPIVVLPPSAGHQVEAALSALEQALRESPTEWLPIPQPPAGSI